ncbi:MAG: hypothetical protein JW936_07095 [Sedimentisphaerales bacterium]|nr:hypothetical protein [Sedimentisphaerales bacterium]
MSSTFNGERKDDRVRCYVLPTRVVSTENTTIGANNPQALLERNEDVCILNSTDGVDPALILDFGRELHGGVSINVAGEACRLADIRLRFGESLAEVMGQPNQDHAIHDISISIPTMSKQEFGMTGFRFVRIDLLSKNDTLPLRQVEAVALENDYPYIGSFECSDELLNQIWRIGARTVHLCCQDYILDGIKRDRLVWMGDIHPQLRVIANVFGNIDIVPESLAYMRDRTPPAHWMNGLSSYSLWWIISVLDWYLYTGNRDFLRQQADYLNALVDNLLIAVKTNPADPLPDAQFLDWPSAEDKPGIAAGLHGLLIWALQSASQIFSYLGTTEKPSNIEPALKALRLNHPNNVTSKQIRALQVLAGIQDAHTDNSSVLANNPCQGLGTWFGYYVLEARALAGDYDGCLDLIRDYWGGMVQLGATTFWEHFDTDWLTNAARIDELATNGQIDVHAQYGAHCFKGLRHSFCHGWAGGPTAWLSEHLLGIKRLTPGYSEISVVAPQTNLEYIEGTIPTPHGTIHIKHTKTKDGTITSQINQPPNIKVLSDDTP